MLNPETGIVIPTLGTRPEFLVQTAHSIRAAGDAHILIVSPDLERVSDILDRSLYDSMVLDPGLGLSTAINLGVDNLPRECIYINWLGDDDLLFPHSITNTS